VELSLVEIFGYFASIVIAFSLTRSSIIKLRWYNLFGASFFCIYGIIINAYPVAVLNGFIAITNVFFLSRLLLKVEQQFSVFEVLRPSNYVDFFINYHQIEIKSLFPRFLNTSAVDKRLYFFLAERTEVVGILSGFEENADTFIVDFDFVIPAYRDCRLGQFVLGEGQQLAKQFHYKHVLASADSIEHENYLIKLGFTPNKNGRWSFETSSKSNSKPNSISESGDKK
jgi:hypothetical protein